MEADGRDCVSTKNNYSVSVTLRVSEKEHSERSSAYFFLSMERHQ